MIRPLLEHEFGEHWSYFAADLDQAVSEFGRFVEGRCERGVNDYVERVRKMGRNLIKRNKNAEMPTPDRQRIEDIWTETISYHVDQIAMKVDYAPTGADADGMPSGGRRVVRTREVTGDRTVDFNFALPGTDEEWL